MGRAILSAFAEAYPTSAHYRGGRKLRLGDWPARLPQIEADVEEREAFLEAVERLASEGVISVRWERFRAGDAVEALYLEDPEQLYALLEAKAPWDTREELLAALEKPPWTEPSLGELSERLRTLLGAHHPLPVADAADLRDLGRILLLTPEETAGAPLRALSVRLFADSKRLEGLLPAADKLAAEAAGEPPSGRLGLKRSYPEVSFSLFGSLELPGGVWQLSGEILTLPLQTVERIRSIRLSPPGPSGETEPAPPAWVLSVENKESFYALTEAARRGRQHPASPAAPPSALIYTAGHPGDAVRALLLLLSARAPALLHFGDMDPDGLLILQELALGTGIAVGPFSMDEATYRRYINFGYRLSEAALKRLGDIRLPELQALAAAIRETKVGVEQEVIRVEFGGSG